MVEFFGLVWLNTSRFDLVYWVLLAGACLLAMGKGNIFNGILLGLAMYIHDVGFGHPLKSNDVLTGWMALQWATIVLTTGFWKGFIVGEILKAAFKKR